MTKLIPTISARIEPANVDQLKIKAIATVDKQSQPNKFDFKLWVSRCFKEFAANTALHGYNHIVREDTAPWERYCYFKYDGFLDWSQSIIPVFSTPQIYVGHCRHHCYHIINSALMDLLELECGNTDHHGRRRYGPICVNWENNFPFFLARFIRSSRVHIILYGTFHFRP